MKRGTGSGRFQHSVLCCCVVVDVVGTVIRNDRKRRSCTQFSHCCFAWRLFRLEESGVVADGAVVVVDDVVRGFSLISFFFCVHFIDRISTCLVLRLCLFLRRKYFEFYDKKESY